MKVKKLSQRRVFTGRVTHVDEVDLDFGNGKRATFELVGFTVVTGVSALPVTATGPLLIKHYQAGMDQESWSLPTGGLEPGEDPEGRMQAELQEELGYKAKKLRLLFRAHPLPGYISTEPGYIYLAEQLVRSQKLGDEDYPIAVVQLSWEQVNTMISGGEIVDMRTLLALLWYQCYYLKNR